MERYIYCEYFSRMRKAVTRVNHLCRHFAQSRGFVSAKMADLNINSKYKMLSGYDIPALGYGVSRLLFCIYFSLAKYKYNYLFTRRDSHGFSLKTRSDPVLIPSMINRFIKRTISPPRRSLKQTSSSSTDHMQSGPPTSPKTSPCTRSKPAIDM